MTPQATIEAVVSGPRTLSLFSGIGGLDLGLERAGFRIVAQCEADPFCRAVLAKHWPGVPCFKDVRELVALLRPLRRLPAYLHARAREVRAMLADLFAIVGGFPCQDVSVAGKGAGVDAGARSGLWREYRRAVAVLRPARVIPENVPALRTRGADRVLGDLEGLGYTCTPLVVGAEHVGAPHRRHRVFIVADANGFGRTDQGNQRIPKHAHARVSGEVRWPARRGRPQEAREPKRYLQLPLGGIVDGVPARLVRAANRNALRAYGNAVVPQVAELIGRAVLGGAA